MLAAGRKRCLNLGWVRALVRTYVANTNCNRVQGEKYRYVRLNRSGPLYVMVATVLTVNAVKHLVVAL